MEKFDSAWIELGVLAVALAVDAAAVSATLGAQGISIQRLTAAISSFGVFQAGMAGLGAVGGAWLVIHAAAWDHWIAFVLLAVVGGRMVVADASESDEPPQVSAVAILGLAVATSIDALAAGVSVPLLDLPLWTALLVIGAVTWVLSGLAGALGRSAGAQLGSWMERLGGVALIAIGLRILLQHLYAEWI